MLNLTLMLDVNWAIETNVLFPSINERVNANARCEWSLNGLNGLRSHNILEQECIPIGCVPSAAVAVSSLGGVCSGGCLLKGLLGGSALGGLLWEVCSGGVCSGGCLLLGVSARGVVSQYALRQTPPPPCGQTHVCKNITFATSLRTVIRFNRFGPWTLAPSLDPLLLIHDENIIF